MLVLCTLSTFAMFCSGCVGSPTVEAMVPKTFAVVNKHPKTVKVLAELTIEEQGQNIWTEIVLLSREEFVLAVEQAVVESGLFRRASESGEQDCLLELFITHVKRPSSGFNMTAAITVIWRLSLMQTRETIFQEAIHTDHKAKVSEAFSGNTRAKKALAGAVRANIHDGIELLSELSLGEE